MDNRHLDRLHTLYSFQLIRMPAADSSRQMLDCVEILMHLTFPQICVLAGLSWAFCLHLTFWVSFFPRHAFTESTVYSWNRRWWWGAHPSRPVHRAWWVMLAWRRGCWVEGDSQVNIALWDILFRVWCLLKRHGGLCQSCNRADQDAYFWFT